MIKTIFTVENWVGIPPEVLNSTRAQMSAWQSQGVWTGHLTDTVVSGTRTIERWDWASTEAAQTYIDTITSILTPQYSNNIQSSIVVE